jgi:hypothetical protein
MSRYRPFLVSALLSLTACAAGSAPAQRPDLGSSIGGGGASGDLAVPTDGGTGGPADGDLGASPDLSPAPDLAQPLPTEVVSATASDPTHVVVTFDHELAGGSLLADGSQFTFTSSGAAITASAASANTATTVTVTTTSQTPAMAYTVTVAPTLKDAQMQGIDATHDAAAFQGFVTTAVLRIDEVNPAINTPDLVELRVVSGGGVGGFTFSQNQVTPQTLATLPDVVMQTGDVIVLHLYKTGTPASTTETSSKTDCSDASCYAGAWDVNGGSGKEIGNSARVLTIRDKSGVVQDTMAFYSTNIANYSAELAAAQSIGQWKPANCGGAACDDSNAKTLMVPGTGLQSTTAGKSFVRSSATDTDSASDWSVAASSWGVANY